jgi:Protein of unknown function (DUF2975)
MSIGRSEVEVSFPAVGPLGRLSAIMCGVVALGGVLAELALIWVWLSPTLIEMLVVPRLGLGGVSVALDGWNRLIGFTVCMLPTAVLGYLLYQAFELFDGYRRGNVFTDAAPVHLRRIGSSMLALAVLRPVTTTLLGVVLTLSNPPGQRIVSIGVSIDDYMIAAFGGLVLAIGHVMVEAKRLADDNRQIV